MWWFKKKEVAAPEPAKEPEAPKVGIRPEAVAEVRALPKREFQRYEPPKGVIPEAIKSAILAMDSTPYDALNAAYGGYGYGDFDSFPDTRIWPRWRRSLNIARWSAPSRRK